MISELKFAVLVHLACLSTANAQIGSFDFPRSYTLRGQSGRNEKFAMVRHDNSDAVEVILLGLRDSLRTVVRSMTSSYKNGQYLVFDNVYVAAGQLINETHIQFVSQSGDSFTGNDWKLVSRNRLSNGNVLVVVSFNGTSTADTGKVFRFLIFDDVGATVLAMTDYYLLNDPNILIEGNGGFAVLIEKDYSPLSVQNCSGKWPKPGHGSATFTSASPAVCVARFSCDGKFLSKTAYLIHNDTRCGNFEILDVAQGAKYNFLLCASYDNDLPHLRSLSVMLVDRGNPSNVIEIPYEQRLYAEIAGGKLRKREGRMYVYLPKPDDEIEIKMPQQGLSVSNIETSTKQPVDKKKRDEERMMVERGKGNEILLSHGIKSECVTYHETPHGTFVGTRLADNTPVNYLMVKGKLSHFPILDSYVIFEYSGKFDGLVVGFFDDKIRFADTMSRDFSIYFLETSRFVRQVKYATEVYGVELSANGDSLVCWPNTKNSGGVGSTPVRQATRVKIH